MNAFQMSVCLLLATAVRAKPTLYAFPTYYEQPGVTPTRHNLLHSVKSQFHAQDELGQYTYGYNDGLSSKVESKTADGITHGSYAYVDSNGILQNVNYISDDVNGFRVSATNLPVAPSYPYPIQEETILAHENPTQTILTVTTADSPSTSEARPTEQIKLAESVDALKRDDTSKTTAIDKLQLQLMQQQPQQQQQRHNTTETIAHDSSMITNAVSPSAAALFPSYQPYQPFTHLSWFPQPLAPLPLTTFRYQPVAQVAPVAPVAPVYSQFHSQDEFGQYSYGYSGGPSSKVEMKTLDGVTRGGYSYVDANGILQKVNYVSDPINGFRVAATNLPISNMAAAYYPTEYHLPELNLLSHPDDKLKND